MVDYRALCLKYLAHVVGCEGVDFLDDPWSGIKFSPEERAFLETRGGTIDSTIETLPDKAK